MSGTFKEKISRLRQYAGAGLLDCKSALEQSNHDFDAAVQFLREKGKAKIDKRSEKSVKQGVVSASSDSNSSVAVVELNCETDFVANTDEFRDYAVKLSINVVRDGISSADVLQKKVEDSPDFRDLVTKLSERIVIGRVALIQSPDDVVGFYVHGAKGGKNVGKIASIISISSDSSNKEILSQVARELCLQISASHPRWISAGGVPQDVIDQEITIFRKECKNTGKPEKAWERIIEGKLKDFYKRECLVSQTYIRDTKKVVSEYIESVAPQVKVNEFFRYGIGCS